MGYILFFNVNAKCFSNYRSHFLGAMKKLDLVARLLILICYGTSSTKVCSLSYLTSPASPWRAVTTCRSAVSDGDARLLLWRVPTPHPLKGISWRSVEVSTPSIRSFPHRNTTKSGCLSLSSFDYISDTHSRSLSSLSRSKNLWSC